MSLSLLPIMLNLTRLESLSLNNIESNYIEMVIDHLSSLSTLSSLIIECIDDIKNQNDIYQKIFHLPALKYCQILIETSWYPTALSVATNEFNSIEYLIINNKVSVEQLDSLLSYVPQLRRLTIGHLDGLRNRRTQESSTTLNYLTNVSLKLYSVSFNDFELSITDLFRQVQVLRIAVSCVGYYRSNMDYLNADRWEQLISINMLNLCVFDFQHQSRTLYDTLDGQKYVIQINKFNSSFWVKHQWFFEHQYYHSANAEAAVFYSTNPYR
jgi:hypothetical protein